MSNKMQESIDVLAHSFNAYQENMDQTINQIKKGLNMENKSLNTQSSNDISARISMLEQALRRKELAPETDDESETETSSEEQDELAAYMRTGRLEGKSIQYQSAQGEGLGLTKSTLNTIFDSMSKSFTLLSKVNQQETTSVLTTVNTVNDATATAGWHDEMKDESTFKLKFQAKDVKLNTCVAVVDVSKSVLEDMNDAALTNWIASRVASDAGQVINKALIEGSNGFEGIKTINAAADNKVAKADPLPGLLRMVAKLDSHLHSGAAWYMNISTFTDLLSKPGNDGQPVLLKHLTDSQEAGAVYNLFGKPVYLLNEMPADKPIMLANLKEGYTVLKHTNVTFLHQLADAYVGKVRYSCRLRVGGAITNEKAFVMATV